MGDWFNANGLALVFLLSWLPLISFLFPLPSMEYAEQTSREITRAMEISDEIGSKFRLMRSDVAKIYAFYSDPEELHKWIILRWGAYAITLLAGLLAALLVLLKGDFLVL